MPKMEKIPKFTPNSSLKLMDQVRQVLRYHHYAINTERTYCQWILRFIQFTEHGGIRVKWGLAKSNPSSVT